MCTSCCCSAFTAICADGRGGVPFRRLVAQVNEFYLSALSFLVPCVVVFP